MERRLAAIMAADMANYSRMMELDELGTLTRQKRHRQALIDPTIAEHRGRVVKSTGDGLLVEFSSVQDAVNCAVTVQEALPKTEEDAPLDTRIQYRIGINLGDIIFDEEDIFGDGVNVAARLEGLAEPGGLCVSDIVHQSLPDQLGGQFRDMGRQRVKNISRPIRAWRWAPGTESQPKPSQLARHQHVQFCSSADGTSIAYSTVGSGPTILRAPHWMNHLEYDLQSPTSGPITEGLANNHRMVRFDQRGNGLSDWDVQRIDADAMIEDMEAVVAAAGLDRFALLGISQGAAYSILYTLMHPEKVSCLVLLGGYLRGRLRRNDPEQEKLYEAACRMIRDGWGSNLPIYRNFFTSSFLPDAPPAVQNRFDELQRVTINAENAERLFAMNARLNLSLEEVARLDLPVLVAHAIGDRIAPIEEGHLLARSIPGAQFVELSGNHHVPIESDAAFGEFFDEALPFLRDHATA